MGQILSHSEVEAILSAVDFSVPLATLPSTARASEKTAEATLYDFEHPVPLRPSQLEGLRLASASTSQSLQDELTNVLHSSVIVNFLGVEQSTFRDYLCTAEKPTCLAILESAETSHSCLLEISRSLVFTLIDRLMGGQPSEDSPSVTMTRPFTEVETRLIDKTLQAILPDLLGKTSSRNSPRMTRLVSDGTLIPEASSNEAVALVSYEVVCGPSQGLMQLCIPWKQVSLASSSNPAEAGELRDRWRSGAIKVPVVATARIATVKLSTRELASLNPGDVLLTDASPSDELSLEVDGYEIFRGTPGQSHDRKVIRLTTSVVSE